MNRFTLNLVAILLIPLATLAVSTSPTCLEQPNPDTGGVISVDNNPDGLLIGSYDAAGQAIWLDRLAVPLNPTFNIVVGDQGRVTLEVTDPISRQTVLTTQYDRYGKRLWIDCNANAWTRQMPSADEVPSWLDDPSDPTDRVYQEGWPIELQYSYANATQSLTAGQLNAADTELELVLAMMAGVYAWNHDGTLEPGWPVDPDGLYRGCSVIQQQGVGQVAFTTWANDIAYLYDQDGRSVMGWPISLQGDAASCPMRKDLDQDNLMETIAGGHDVGAGYAWYDDGVNFPNWPVYFTQNVTGMAIGDVNNDGADEIVYTSTSLASKKVWIVSADGDILQEWIPITYDVISSQNYPALADLDGDGDLEILLGGSGGEVWCWHHDGSEYWHHDTSLGGGVSQMAIGDLEGDGWLDIVMIKGGYICAYLYNGELREGKWPFDIPIGGWLYGSSERGGVAIGDIDDDGIQEVVVNGMWHGWKVAALEPDGSPTAGFPFMEPDGFHSPTVPVITDLDGDGDVEICSYAEDYGGPYDTARIVVYDLPSAYNPDLVDWPMIQNNPQRTGCYGDNYRMAAAAAQAKPLSITETADIISTVTASPNPFNPSTILSYQLQTADYVNLTIYDIRGQKVTELVDARQAEGQHQVTFDAAHLPSGVYIASWQIGSRQSIQKLLLLK